MMKYFTLLFLVCYNFVLFGQEFRTLYYGNTTGAGWNIAYAAALPDGGCIAAGTANTLPTGGYRVFLLRSDNQGNLLWTKTFMQGKANFVALTADNGFVFGGQTEKTPFGKTDGFVAKTDASGNLQWTTLLNLDERGEVTCVRPAPGAGYVLCGNVVKDNDNGQDIFRAALNAQGTLTFYQEKGDELADQARDIFVASNGDILLFWMQNSFEILSRFSANGQQKWEKNLDIDFNYSRSSQGSTVAESADGSLYLAGGYSVDLNMFGLAHPEVLRFSAGGNLLQRTQHPDFNGCPPVFIPAPDGSMACFFTKSSSPITSSTLVRLSFNSQGNLTARDTSVLSGGRISQLMPFDKTRLLARMFTFYENDIPVFVLQAGGNQFAVAGNWNFNSGKVPSTDYYRAHCRLIDGGYLVLAQVASATGYGFDFYVFKTDARGENATPPVFILAITPSQTVKWQLEPLPDGGALLYTGNKNYWKIDASGNIVWYKQLQSGYLLAGPGNHFSVLLPRYQWSQGQATLLWRYNSDGELLEEKSIPISEQQGYMFGGISRLDGGYTLFGGRLMPGNTLRNWVVYLDDEGNLLADAILNSTDFYVSAGDLRFLRTSTDGLLLAGMKYHDSSSNIPSNAAYVIRVENGGVTWDHSFGEQTGQRFVRIRDIEEVPCQGFVLSLDAFEARSNVAMPYPPAETLGILHRITADGNSGANFFYHHLPVPETPDIAFIPGYTFRQWGDVLNGQTRDVYFTTIAFPGTDTVSVPDGKVGIFPNPSAGDICLRIDGPENGRLDVEIFTADGRLLDQFFGEKLEDSWITAYSAPYPAGNYLIRVTAASGKRFSGKWLKGR